MTNSTCNHCGETKPLTAEFFYKDKRHSTGLRASICKECVKENRRSYYETISPEQMDKRREQGRERYRNNPAVREHVRQYGYALRAQRKIDFANDPELQRLHRLAQNISAQNLRRRKKAANVV